MIYIKLVVVSEIYNFAVYKFFYLKTFKVLYICLKVLDIGIQIFYL